MYSFLTWVACVGFAIFIIAAIVPGTDEDDDFWH